MDVQTFLSTLQPEILDPEEHIDLQWLYKELERLGHGIVPVGQFIEDGVLQDLLAAPESLEIIDLLLDTRLADTRRRQSGKAAPSELALDDRWLQQTLRALQRLIGSEEELEKSLEMLITGALLNKMGGGRRRDLRGKKFINRVRTLVEEAVSQVGNGLEFDPEYRFRNERLSRGYNAAIFYKGKPLVVVYSTFLVAPLSFSGKELDRLLVDQQELARDGISLLVIADGIGFRSMVRTVERLVPQLPFFTNLYGSIDEIPRALAAAITARPEVEQAIAEARYMDSRERITRLLRSGLDVTPERLELPEAVARDLFERYRAEHSDYAYQSRDQWQLTVANAKELQELGSAFDLLADRDAAAADTLITLLATHLDYTILTRQLEPLFTIYGLQLPRSRLELPEPLPVAIFTGSSTSSQHRGLAALDSVLVSLRTRPRYGIVIDVRNPLGTRREAELLANQGRGQFAVLDRDAITDILLHRPEAARQRFMRALFSGIDLSKTPPFQLNEAVTEQHFYGRDLELRQIAEHVERQSFALIGGRRAGKTSILQRLARDLPPEHHIAFVNAQNLLTRKLFLRYLIDETPVAKRTELEPTEARTDAILRAFLDSKFGLNTSGVLLIDEVDALFDDDANASVPHLVSGALRTLSQAKRAMTVMAGERILAQLVRDPESPHWNFATPIPVGPLDEESARRLLYEPLKEIGIRISDSALKLVLERTGRHPNLLQQLGSKLVQYLAPRLRSGAAPQIERTDVETLTSANEFAREVVSIFWSRATTLEKYLSVQLKAETPYDLDYLVAAMRNIAAQVEVSAIEQALAMLETYGVIKNEKGGYVLAVPILESYYRQVVKASMLEDWELKLQ